jgi:hypothetical protein
MANDIPVAPESVTLTIEPVPEPERLLASAEAEARRLQDELVQAGRDIVFGRMTP